METSRIFVTGLPPSLTEAEFRKHFSAKNREVTDVKLIPQRRIGYVGFKTPDEASKAVKYFNRTYIRMSRIGVEPARPISDPALTNDSAQRRRSRFPASDKHIQESARLPSDDASSSKKRKRDGVDSADPKLQEYLQVMNTSQAGILAEQSGGDGVGIVEPEGAKLAVPEDESDDDYEQIPSRREKHRKTEHKDGALDDLASSTPSVVPEKRHDARDTTMETTQEVQNSVDPVPGSEGVAATDDDWLRSRTNRMLDLVDPDELDIPTPQAPRNGSTLRDVNHNTSHEDTPKSHNETTDDATTETAEAQAPDAESTVDQIRRTSRLFVRNLAYTANEDDMREAFSAFGPLEEIHLPIGAGGSPKGYALVLFADPSNAVEAFQALDGTTFQGRLLHIIPASAKRETLDEFELSKLPLKKQNMIRKRAEASSSTFNWNSMYMSQDAVNESTASRLGVSKSELLDPTSADAAVKQAIAETSVIQETKAYFAANGVDLNAFQSHKRGDTAILVKNFPYGTTIEEIRALFEESGPVLRVLMPPSGTIAIVQFGQANHARSAFGKLAYRRIKDSVLFLEKAPKDLFTNQAPEKEATRAEGQPIAGVQKLSVNELLSRGDKADEEVETTSLFIRNLNFATTTSRLAEVFGSLDGFVSTRVKTKTDAKKPGQTLSMGFGFAEFASKAQAQTALQTMDGYVLDGHKLTVKASHKGLDAAEERRREDKAKQMAGQRTKVIIKNLPFQTTKKDVRALFGTYGQLRSVRVPKKADFSTRGFAFAEFVTAREAENALNALKDTHLLGRRLVLEFAEADAVDAEEEIAKMQRKVGGQVNKVALQKLTGGGRKKVNIGNDEEADEG